MDEILKNTFNILVSMNKMVLGSKICIPYYDLKDYWKYLWASNMTQAPQEYILINSSLGEHNTA